MTTAKQALKILPGVLEWAAHSPEHKVELTSHAVQTKAGWWIFDPIPLSDEARWFPPGCAIAGIVLTNENHERDAAAWSARYSVPIQASDEAGLTLLKDARVPHGRRLLGDWNQIRLPGGAGGETAWHWPDRSLLVIGDAVIHLPGRGLEVLPDRYCRDPRQLRESLRQLPAAENAVFAHGQPLSGGATRRILELVG